MLKTLGALAASKNLSIDGADLDDAFMERLRFIDLLEDTSNWDQPLGLYMLQGTGNGLLEETTLNSRHSFCEAAAMLLAFGRTFKVFRLGYWQQTTTY